MGSFPRRSSRVKCKVTRSKKSRAKSKATRSNRSHKSRQSVATRKTKWNVQNYRGAHENARGAHENAKKLFCELFKNKGWTLKISDSESPIKIKIKSNEFYLEYSKTDKNELYFYPVEPSRVSQNEVLQDGEELLQAIIKSGYLFASMRGLVGIVESNRLTKDSVVVINLSTRDNLLENWKQIYKSLYEDYNY